MHIYIYIERDLFVCIYIYICIYKHRSLSLYIYIYIHVYMCIYIYIYGNRISTSAPRAPLGASAAGALLRASRALPGRRAGRIFFLLYVSLVFSSVFLFLSPNSQGWGSGFTLPGCRLGRIFYIYIYIYIYILISIAAVHCSNKYSS